MHCIYRNCGGRKQSSAIVKSPQAPSTRSLGCGADTVTIWPYISTPTTNLSYSWTAAPNATVRGQNTRYLSANLPGLYRVQVTDNSNGCKSSTNMKIETGTLTAD